MNRLFLYGTLREDQPARAMVAPNVARWEPATTTGMLYSLPQGYPGYVPGPGTVVGEIAWLTDVAVTLRRLDEYEGDEYSRVVCQVFLQSGRHTSAWVYALTDAASIASNVPGRAALPSMECGNRSTRSATIIAGGDWVRHLAKPSEVSRPR